LQQTISVIGLGYVGLPVAISAAENGFKVFGIDLDLEKVNAINSGKSDIEDIDNKRLSFQIDRGSLKATNTFEVIHGSSIVLICVPTPIGADRKPDLTSITSAVKSLSKFLDKGTLVILESTVAPGTTRDFLIPLIEQNSNFHHDDLEFAFSPERIDPTNKQWTLENTPKIVSGFTEKSCQNAVKFYEKFVANIVVCKTLEIAETAKVLENSFRLVNISFINELSVFCQKMGIDIVEVIHAAATKPYGYMPFYPSIGVGGHCIPVDPLYLSHKAREIGAPTSFIDLADKVNQDMPNYFVSRAESEINGLTGKKVLIIGVAYKPNVADIRETKVEALISGLEAKGAKVFWHDDLVKEWNGEKSVALSNEYDLAIIATPHTYLDLTKLGDIPILNTRGSI
jgi:UDP-N-acetyl-D-glucosamine dehydrogenase